MGKAVMVVVAVGLLLGVVAGGCGDSDGDGDSTLTKAQYQKRADTICERGAEEKDKALASALRKAEESGKAGNSAAYAELIRDEGLPPLTRMTEELKSLDGPQGDEEQAEAMAAAFEEEVESIAADPQAALGGAGGQFEKANELAKELGLEACSAI